MHNLTLYLKELEKEQQINPKAIRRREKIKFRVETNDKDEKKAEQINETKNWLLKK